LTPVGAHQANEKAVNEVYLQTLVAGSLDLSPTQIGILLTIAAQCPSTGGESVIRAINLLPPCEAAPFKTMLDDCYITPPLLTVKLPGDDLASSSEFRVFPNPASHELQVRTGTAVFANGEIRLVNLLGEAALTQTFESGTTNFTFPVDGLPVGLYSCNVYLDGKLHVSEKLMVSR
jgi:Secretion system C-terminal sorting domain